MQCPKCDSENREEAKFCSECGEKLELKCPKCGNEIKPSSKFCDECGHNLKKTKDTSLDYAKPSSYTPVFLADKILTSRGGLEGERKVVTVLFADLVGSTAISEKLDPEEMHRIMDGCFQIMLNEIHRSEGTVIQFTGDGAMAIFGAPIAHEEHAQRACHAALAIKSEMVSYAEKVEREYGIEFRIRIGLNSGPVIVTSIGDDLKMDYTAIGDTVNLASRMESNAKVGSVQVSGHTWRIARNYFEFESLGKI
jgi:class 3 adenylate cyclase